MSDVLSFVFEGKPVAQGRPRATMVGGRAHVYDPKASREYKKVLRDIMLADVASKKYELTLRETDVPSVKVDIRCYFGFPSKWTKAQREEALKKCDKMPCLKKPDCDNLAKIVLDAATGILWHDDNSVYDLHVAKFYSDVPRVEMDVMYP